MSTKKSEMVSLTANNSANTTDAQSAASAVSASASASTTAAATSVAGTAASLWETGVTVSTVTPLTVSPLNTSPGISGTSGLSTTLSTSSTMTFVRPFYTVYSDSFGFDQFGIDLGGSEMGNLMLAIEDTFHRVARKIENDYSKRTINKDPVQLKAADEALNRLISKTTLPPDLAKMVGVKPGESEIVIKGKKDHEDLIFALANRLINNNQIIGSLTMFCPLTLDETIVLAQALKNNKTLRYLKISGLHGLNNLQIALIFDALKYNTTLEEFSIDCLAKPSEGVKYDVFSGDFAAYCFMYAFEFNKTLKKLHILDAGITAIGAEALYKGLNNGTAVKELDLMYNKIDLKNEFTKWLLKHSQTTNILLDGLQAGKSASAKPRTATGVASVQTSTRPPTSNSAASASAAMASKVKTEEDVSAAARFPNPPNSAKPSKPFVTHQFSAMNNAAASSTSTTSSTLTVPGSGNSNAAANSAQKAAPNTPRPTTAVDASGRVLGSNAASSAGHSGPLVSSTRIIKRDYMPK